MLACPMPELCLYFCTDNNVLCVKFLFAFCLVHTGTDELFSYLTRKYVVDYQKYELVIIQKNYDLEGVI